MKPKSYWVLSDGKTVREITHEKWKEIVNADYTRQNKRLVVKVWDSEIYFRKGKRTFWIRREPLETILNIK